MGIEVSLDSRGRLLLPSDVREELGTSRFILSKRDGMLELEPIPEPENVRGKYRGLLDKDIQEIEEDQETFIREGKR
jgi:DNA-binding transcriptional regulator/RsmH inhibitor MraZ